MPKTVYNLTANQPSAPITVPCPGVITAINSNNPISILREDGGSLIPLTQFSPSINFVSPIDTIVIKAGPLGASITVITP